MGSSRQETKGNRRDTPELARLVLQTVAPALAVDLLMLTRMDAGLTVLGIQFCDWAPFICAVWALIVVYWGPFALPKRLDRTGKEERYVAERNSGSS
jgi:hypothetical protein